MSENANKGILITPSDYTEQAYSFAKGKNLELINGNILNNLIAEYTGIKLSSNDIKSSADGFNFEQYNYLMQCVDNEPTSPKYYLQAIDFLRNSIIEDAPYVQAANIFDKIIDLNTRLMKRCYKKKTDIYYRKACWYRIAEIEIIRGNLGSATNILLDNNWFYIKEWIPALFDVRKSVSQEAFSKCTLARNLYSAFKSINHKNACSEIIKMIDIGSEIKKITHKHIYLLGEKT